MDWLKDIPPLPLWKLGRFADIIPFACFVNGKPHLNTSRIMEMLIGAAVIGLLAGYISAREIKIEVSNLKAQVTRIETRVDRIYEEGKK